MATFSANLGFLWQDLSLPDAIRAAKKAGFVAVECHWPYQYSTQEIAAALQETGLPMLGLNTARGNVAAGDNGLAAIPGREAEAREAIDQAIEYAAALGVANVHVMAGNASGEDAHRTFLSNLDYASKQAAKSNITILIEPLNRYDAAEYFLKTSVQAIAIIKELQVENLKLMFDCYHLQIMEGDISRRLETSLPYIGHIQIAAVPDRAEPDHGELNYQHVLGLLDSLGYQLPIGAEYKPRSTTEAGLSWMRSYDDRGRK